MELRVKEKDQPYGELLREARQRANLSQVELADKLGVAPRTVQYWEAGRIVPQPRHRRALVEFLGALEDEAA